jgi:hypothetical protein
MYRVTIPVTVALKSLYFTRPFNHKLPQLRWSQLAIYFVCIGWSMAFIVRRFAPVSAAADRR